MTVQDDFKSVLIYCIFFIIFKITAHNLLYIKKLLLQSSLLRNSQCWYGPLQFIEMIFPLPRNNILTEDSTFRMISNLTTINPFSSQPSLSQRIGPARALPFPRDNAYVFVTLDESIVSRHRGLKVMPIFKTAKYFINMATRICYSK